MIIENIEDLRKVYKQRVPHMFCDFAEGGSWTESTLKANREDFQKIKLRSRVGIDITNRDTSATLLGQKCSIPAILAPVGMLGMQHANGEILAAQAAEEFGVPFCLSTMSICSIEDVAKYTKNPFWFQLYVIKDKSFTANLIKRAKDVGCSTLVLTLDCKVSGRRHRDIKNGLTVPIQPTLQNLINLCTKFRWCYNQLKSNRHTFGNIVGYADGVNDLRKIADWTNNQFDKSFTWDDIDWIRNQWPGKLIIKGIMDPEDAEIASNKTGVDAIVVSNHGGRQLDGAPSTISVISNITSSINMGQTEIILDSGIMSGQDILKAIALGAKGVMIGRSYVYGLGAYGKHGVLKSLEIMQKEIDLTMAFCGINYIENINKEIIYESM